MKKFLYGFIIIGKLFSFFPKSDVGHSPALPKIPVINPSKTIDFIAYAPGDKFIVIEHKVIDEKYASDHLPLFSIVRIKQ